MLRFTKTCYIRDVYGDYMKIGNIIKKTYCFYMLILSCFAASQVLLFFSAAFVFADEPLALSNGQTLYVPAYSHIYTGDREFPMLLTVTLSIRNVDSKYPMTVSSIRYYGTKGELIRKILDKAVTLKALESIRYVIPQKDKAGGSGANFLVDWHSERPLNPPIVESIMIGTEGQQGISFTSRAQPITTLN